ncbi:hypothetical protein [Enterococcus caccae]|uniref:SCP domain-containing protein n=1 Tax=Enterococcus caccae ATCC BAA-1240 TaxID=1158612 RepID=R3U9P8_9ENTE|nr:hypothetical protein [Enterococcus caccae]EOL50719.1 hypothetical protein UC7_00170 [Enterococcus caccae ATCC BAA-1240]EOT59388.1 hypothetical protein I580_02420 [Enterococcus caccae ATCC BAA-1240]OJG27705.1 hypothetical protein RU98_GL002408 [Enterococcus caccae]
MKKFLLGITLLVCLGFGTNVEAQERYEISENNTNLIEELTSEEPANSDYINNTIDMYYEVPSENDSSEDFNSFLNSVLVELKNYDNKQDEKLENQLETAEENVDLSLNSNLPKTSRALVATPYDLALTAYVTGIKLVERRGHWQTANYMRRAIVPANRVNTAYTPATYYNTNDTWARMVDSEDLMRSYYGRLKAEAFRGGRASGSFTGVHRFTSGHLLTALRGVSYTVSYKRQANGYYYTTVKVTDIFDFAWEPNGYNDFAVGFGNNYCYAMQSRGYIKPYKIEIVRSMSR